MPATLGAGKGLPAENAETPLPRLRGVTVAWGPSRP
jgi:hypothetical protein